MKKRFFLSLLLGFLLLLSGCTLLEKLGLSEWRPAFELERIELKSISLTRLDLLLHTKISNPYPIELPDSSLDLKLDIEGIQLARLLSGSLSIPARETSAVPFNVELIYEDLYNIYKKVPEKEVLHLKLAGTFTVPIPESKRKYVPGAPEKLTFDFAGESNIPAVLPSIAIQNFQILEPSVEDIRGASGATEDLVNKTTGFLKDLLKKGGRSPGSAVQAGLNALNLKIETTFEIILDNQAASRLEFESIEYDFFLGQDRLLSGKNAGFENKGRQSIITVKTSFPIGEITSAIAGAIKNRRAEFHLTGGSNIKIPALPDVGIIPFRYDKKGTLTW